MTKSTSIAVTRATGGQMMLHLFWNKGFAYYALTVDHLYIYVGHMIKFPGILNLSSVRKL